MTREILTRALDYSPAEGIFVAWTGGKDSTVALDLWNNFLIETRPDLGVRALNLDTGYKFPEVLHFRDEVARERGIDLRVIRPDKKELEMAERASKVECCRKLKVNPLQDAITQHCVQGLVTGIRRDEHPSRENTREIQEKDAGYIQINPIAHWTEMDIWSYTVLHGLRYCSLYDRGYRSLGCAPCTFRDSEPGERTGRDREKEESLEYLRSLGYF